MQKTVTVLMATLNGEQYLDDQLTSLCEQLGVNVEVYVNDDGSTDKTLEILKRWEKRGLIVSISESKGLGSTKAYFNLLKLCDDKSLVAFCDQDDIWKKDKLISQILEISSDSPCMSTCMREYIDKSGEIIGKSRPLNNSPTFLSASVENIAPGNTVLLNNSAVKMVNSFEYPKAVHYDSWIYLLVSAFGDIRFIPKHLVQYRVHSLNSVGLRKYSINRLTSSVSSYLDQIEYFAANKSIEMAQINERFLEKIVAFRSSNRLMAKLVLLFEIEIKRQSKVDAVIFKFMMLFQK